MTNLLNVAATQLPWIRKVYAYGKFSAEVDAVFAYCDFAHTTHFSQH